MPTISLTDFVDFVIKVGTPKLTKVAQVKHRKEYEPAFDFWKPLRDSIIRYHKSNQTDPLDAFMVDIDDSKKLRRYPFALRGYKKFLGRKKMQWFDPPVKDWVYEGLTVRVNPELGLEIRGMRHAIKLYFKDDPLSKRRIDAVIALMEQVLSKGLSREVKMGILDVSNGKLFATAPSISQIDILLRGEAASFLQMWNSL